MGMKQKKHFQNGRLKKTEILFLFPHVLYDTQVTKLH